jgi:outer membrane protein assembly factor BamB
MQTSKRIFTIATLALALLLVSSPFIGPSSPITTVNIPSVAQSEHVDPITGQPYGDIMQYNWPIQGYDSQNTRFNPGPGPNRADVLWTFRRPDGRSVTGGPLTAIDGKIITYGTSGPDTLYALDPFDGSIIWEAPIVAGGPLGFGTGSVFKVDDTHLGWLTFTGVAFYEIEDGDFVSQFTIDSDVHGLSGLVAGQVLYWAGFYDYEDKLLISAARNTTTNQHMAVAFDCSNPPANATIAWTWGAPTGLEALGSGGGLCFFGGYGEGEIYAINATTGQLKWRSWKIGNSGYSVTYHDGKVYHAASSTRVTCYDAEDGSIIWDADQGPRGFFAFGGAMAYGLYFDKCMAIPGYVAAWDAEDGTLRWKQPAHYTITYAVPAVADGKLYCSTSDQSEGSTVAGMVSPGYSFTCFDAFTGEVIWKVPYNIALPMIAFGNLYFIRGGSVYCLGENTDPWDRYGGPQEKRGTATGQYAPSDLSQPAWTYETDGPITGSPVAADGKVYFGSYDKHIYCLDAYEGTLIWKFPTGYRVASTPTIVDDTVYTGADDGYIYAIDADAGTQIWKRYAGGLQPDTLWSSMAQIRSSPIVVDDMLYVGAMDGNLYCLDTTTADGTVEWTYTVSDTESGLGGSPIVSEGVVYIASGDGRLYAIDAAAGTQIWNVTLTPSNRYMSGTPTVIEEMGIILATAHTGGLFGRQYWRGYNTTDGSLLWDAGMDRAWGGSTPAVHPPTYRWNGTYAEIYLPEGMYATEWVIVNSSYVERVWDQWTGRQVYTPLICAESEDGVRLYYGSDVYSINCLDAEDGSPISSYTTMGQVYGAPAIYDGRLYVGSYDFHLYCFADTHEVCPDIWAVSSKGTKMLVNETVTISGGLRAIMTYADERVPDRSETYYPQLAGEDVKVTFSGPNQTMIDRATTTDAMGLFEVSYTPTVAGDWTWMAWYEGRELSHISYTYAYGDLNSLQVVGPEAPPTNGEEPPPEGMPIEYVYAAVAIIAIVIILVVAYLYMKRRK